MEPVFLVPPLVMSSGQHPPRAQQYQRQGVTTHARFYNPQTLPIMELHNPQELIEAVGIHCPVDWRVEGGAACLLLRPQA